jgi:hypothetical protein
MRPRPLLSLVTLALVASPLGSARAEAPTIETCAKAYEGAQQRIHGGALIESREDLGTCVAVCPVALARDCTTWKGAVERDIPSLQVSIKVTDGSAPGEVRVRIDGALSAELLPGASLPVDPGKHVLVFEAPGRPRVEVLVDVPRGRQGFEVDVVFPAAPLALPPRERPRTPRPVGPLVLASLGVGALGVAGVLGIDGQVKRAHLAGTCAPNCAQSSVDAIDREWKAGGVLAGVGGAVALGGILWWALSSRDAGTGPALTLVPSPRGASVVGRF